MKMKRNESKVSLTDLLNQFNQRRLTSPDLLVYKPYFHIYQSVVLDGNLLTIDQVAALFTISTPSPINSQAEAMVLDCRKAFELVTSLASNKQPINRTLVQELGAQVMKQTGGFATTILSNADSRKGDFRDYALNGNGGIYDRPYRLVEHVDELCKRINSSLQLTKLARRVYELSFEVHYEFLRIQPFVEGNGRVARLLMNYIQLYHNLPQSVVFNEDRQAYQTSIHPSTVRQHAGMKDYRNSFVDFMFEQLIKMLTMTTT